MQYEHTLTGIFLARPNRFLAHVMIGKNLVVCHVKNTGRLKELLIPGVRVILQFHPDAASAKRKTEYSLIGVEKPAFTGKNSVQAKSPRTSWVNIDSQAPNFAAWEWLTAGNRLPFSRRPLDIKREVRFGDSRFDLSFSHEGRPWFMEVKGVTLDLGGTAMFPDAPTERGVKHLEELSKAAGLC